MSTKTLVLNGPKRTLFQKIVLHFQKHWRLHVLALPAFLSLLAFAYAPMFGVVLAFQKYSIQGGFFGSEWIGFKNFEFLFQTSDAWRITRSQWLPTTISFRLDKSRPSGGCSLDIRLRAHMRGGVKPRRGTEGNAMVQSQLKSFATCRKLTQYRNIIPQDLIEIPTVASLPSE